MLHTYVLCSYHTIWQPHLGKPGFINTLVRIPGTRAGDDGAGNQGRVPFIRTFTSPIYQFVSINLLRLVDSPTDRSRVQTHQHIVSPILYLPGPKRQAHTPSSLSRDLSARVRQSEQQWPGLETSIVRKASARKRKTRQRNLRRSLALSLARYRSNPGPVQLGRASVLSCSSPRSISPCMRIIITSEGLSIRHPGRK